MALKRTGAEAPRMGAHVCKVAEAHPTKQTSAPSIPVAHELRQLLRGLEDVALLLLVLLMAPHKADEVTVECVDAVDVHVHRAESVWLPEHNQTFGGLGRVDGHRSNATSAAARFARSHHRLTLANSQSLQ